MIYQLSMAFKIYSKIVELLVILLARWFSVKLDEEADQSLHFQLCREQIETFGSKFQKQLEILAFESV